MRLWTIFCIGFSILIAVGLMLPRFFGLQNFTQWAGMYVDGWCVVDLYSSNPFDALHPPVSHEAIYAGGVRASNVFDPPQFNQQTCAIWAKTRCGKLSPTDKWSVSWAVPTLKKNKFLGSANACDLPVDADSWFRFTP